MKELTLALVILAYAAATTAGAQKCGWDDYWDGRTEYCANNKCCSKAYWCGRSSDYCGDGGVSGPCYSRLPCGYQSGGALCWGNRCCSQYGWCGSDYKFCGYGCQNGPCWARALGLELGGAAAAGGVAAVVTRDLFDHMLPRRNDPACPAHGFYTYEAFVAAAADAFPAFGTTGDDDDARKREVAAFLAHTSNLTSGGPSSWGYCYKEVNNSSSDHCVPSADWPCAPGKKYHARGPMQITYNYNYGPAGRAIGVDLLGSPDLVTSDPVVAFKTALWLWMTPPSPEQPSPHDALTGSVDRASRGFGLAMSILSDGAFKCADDHRVGLYKRYCDILGVSSGADLGCDNQPPVSGTIRSLAQ